MRTVTPETWNAADLAPGDRVVATYGVIRHQWYDERFDVHAVTHATFEGTRFTTIQVGPQPWELRTYRSDTPMQVHPGGPK